MEQRARRRSESGGVRDYVRVLRRRMWLVLTVVAVVTGFAVFLSLREQPLYQASAEVLLKYQNLAANLTGIQDFSGVYQDPTRIAVTQTKVALSPEVARRTIRAARLTGMTPSEFLGHAAVTVEPDSDILDFNFTDSNAERAARAATAHARQYIVHRKALDTAAISLAGSQIAQRLKQLRAEGQTRSSLYNRLEENEQQLRTMGALQTANASVLREADGAAQIQPRPVRNGVLGFTLGLLLALGIAFFREALDTRVRSATEVGERLDLPLLARLAEPPRGLRTKQRLVMRERPQSVDAESFRMLRTNLDFVNLERGARTLMVTSALQGEGKTTTAANLAVAIARAGKRVVVVDLDMRRPMVHEYFQLDAQPGLTEVALGHVMLDDAITRVALTSADSESTNGQPDDPESTNGQPEIERVASTNGRAKVEGSLEVLPAGLQPPDPGEFVNTHALVELLHAARDRADMVVIDTPPLLSVGDGLVLSAHVDAMLVVTRLSAIRRPTIAELRRVLDSCPASKLGFVLTAADLEEGYGYGTYAYSYYYGSSAPRKVVRGQTQ